MSDFFEIFTHLTFNKSTQVGLKKYFLRNKAPIRAPEPEPPGHSLAYNTGSPEYVKFFVMYTEKKNEQSHPEKKKDKETRFWFSLLGEHGLYIFASPDAAVLWCFFFCVQASEYAVRCSSPSCPPPLTGRRQI